MSKKRQPAQTSKTSPVLWLLIGVGVVAVIAALFFLLQPRASVGGEISVTQAYEKYQQGVFFVDVRTQEEWDSFHAANSVLIPLDQLPNRLSEIPKDREVVLICRSGHRSKQALDILQKSGYTNAFSMMGGLNEWKSTGHPVVAKGQ